MQDEDLHAPLLAQVPANGVLSWYKYYKKISLDLYSKYHHKLLPLLLTDLSK
jgi:hypothetical protein